MVGPVFEGGEEANILTLLTSLANVCRHDEGLVVTAPVNITNVNEANGHKSSKALECDKTSGTAIMWYLRIYLDTFPHLFDAYAGNRIL